MYKIVTEKHQQKAISEEHHLQKASAAALAQVPASAPAPELASPVRQKINQQLHFFLEEKKGGKKR